MVVQCKVLPSMGSSRNYSYFQLAILYEVTCVVLGRKLELPAYYRAWLPVLSQHVTS
jgi:hypothetical protein